MSNKKIYFVLSMVLVCFLKCHTIKENQITKDCKYKGSNKCELLKILSDSTNYSRLFTDSDKNVAVDKYVCFEKLFNELYIGTDMRPFWTCNFIGCTYSSYSLEKSIYKIDLLRLMKYYKCQDTLRLMQSTKGNFTKTELEIIKSQNRSTIKIDTFILYPGHSR